MVVPDPLGGGSKACPCKGVGVVLRRVRIKPLHNWGGSGFLPPISAGNRSIWAGGVIILTSLY